MFPGYVSIYRDADGYVHLYFFKGIDDNLKQIYQDIDLKKCQIEHSKIENSDGSMDYKFKSKRIRGMICNLIDKDNNEYKIPLKL